METPEIRLNEVETFEAGDSSTVVTENHEFADHTTMEATSTEVVPTDLTELVRKLNNATEIVGSAIPNALPGDQALLVGLTVQIQALAQLFVESAQAMVDAETDTLPLAEED